MSEKDRIKQSTNDNESILLELFGNCVERHGIAPADPFV